MTSSKGFDQTKNDRVKTNLARGSAPIKRTQETLSIVVFFTLYFMNGYYLVKHFHSHHYQSLIFGIFSGIIATDFASGVVHWGCDTWGSIDLPIIGHALIRGFREHHVDATAITRHDFVETNGDNFLVASIILMMQSYRFYFRSAAIVMKWAVFEYFIIALAIFGAFTNQIHKWAHTYYNLPRVVEWLQKCHIILPRHHHKMHHVAPHDTYFCITTGWLNYPLEQTGFWTAVESIIEKLTGVPPRLDDLAWASTVSDVNK